MTAHNEWLEPALALFREACELPADERASFLERATGEDTELRAHVEAMLACDDDESAAINGTAIRTPVRDALSSLAREAESTPADARPDAAAIPETIGDYRVVRFIAHGGMGDVYEAEQEHPRRRVAIKVARTGGATTERARRFELEAQLLARLDHPGIARIIEAGTTPPEAGAQPFFVMELVEGQSLTDHATAHLRAAREKLELMVRIAEAVGYAHTQGVIHRDLKPDNVLIDAAGAPKVLDFGVAKVEAAGGFGAATLRTQAGRVIGTLGYMAPEQLGGKTEGLGPEADVYSLGVMLYELLSGRLPHELDGVTLTRALAVVTTTDAPLLGVIRPEHRGDIEAVVAKALEKDARHRYADAGALKADLERYLLGEPTLARPAGPLLRVTKWTRRNPALATAVFGLFLALAAVAAVLLVKNREVLTALAENRRLLDSSLVKQAELDSNDADEMWPTRPETVIALEKWLATYRGLVGRIPDHEAALDRIRVGALTREPWSFAHPQQRKEHDALAKLVRDVQALADDTALFARMERRLAMAETVVERTVDDRRADWDAAIARIERKYPPMERALTPQVGLIPLGPDPVSGLEEFLHFETHRGALPPPGNGERIPLAMGDDTGLVFVLIPGGKFWMGSQNTNEKGRNYYKEKIAGSWEPLRELPVGAFFLSKYEMTQGQWQRSAGSNPSPVESPTKPVTAVSLIDCRTIMQRLGLAVPDEAQWEYATRAGTHDQWWTGSDQGSLEGAENLCDLTTMEMGAAKWWPEKANMTPAPWRDLQKKQRYDRDDRGPATVGSYRANGFGLFDVAGNVAEWCEIAHDRDAFKSFGDRVGMLRGGTHKRGVKMARSAARLDFPAQNVSAEVGLRPARAIQP